MSMGDLFEGRPDQREDLASNSSFTCKSSLHDIRSNRAAGYTNFFRGRDPRFAAGRVGDLSASQVPMAVNSWST